MHGKERNTAPMRRGGPSMSTNWEQLAAQREQKRLADEEELIKIRENSVRQKRSVVIDLALAISGAGFVFAQQFLPDTVEGLRSYNLILNIGMGTIATMATGTGIVRYSQLFFTDEKFKEKYHNFRVRYRQSPINLDFQEVEARGLYD